MARVGKPIPRPTPRAILSDEVKPEEESGELALWLVWAAGLFVVEEDTEEIELEEELPVDLEVVGVVVGAVVGAVVVLEVPAELVTDAPGVEGVEVGRAVGDVEVLLLVDAGVLSAVVETTILWVSGGYTIFQFCGVSPLASAGIVR